MFRERRFWTFSGLYVVLTLASLPLLLGWVPPNRFYGFRLPGAMEDPMLWDALNHTGALYFMGAMVICLVLNVVLFWLAPPQMRAQAHWINALLILLAFWLVTVQLLPLVPA